MFDMKPLPGDHNLVRDDGNKMVGIADQIHEAARTLVKVASYDGYRGEAVTALRENAKDLAEVLNKAEVRYRDAGTALQWYADRLHEAQVEANRAIARNANTDVVGASAWVARADTEVLIPTLDPQDKLDAMREANRAHTEAAHQAAEVAAARWEYEQAKHHLDVAAVEAANRIHSANERSITDGFADHYKDFLSKNQGWLSPLLEALKVSLDAVSDICLVVAVVVAASSLVLGPEMLAVAGFIYGISKVLSMASFAVTWSRLLIGDATYGDVVMASLFVVAGSVIGKLLKVKNAGIAGKELEKEVTRKGFQYKWGFADSWHASQYMKPSSADELKEPVNILWDVTSGPLQDAYSDWADISAGGGSVWNTKPFEVQAPQSAGDYTGIDVSATVRDNFGVASPDAPFVATPCKVELAA